MIPNYIPHPTTPLYNRERWHNHYKEELIVIRNIILRILQQYYSNIDIIDDAVFFNELSKLIYLNSSRYIDN